MTSQGRVVDALSWGSDTTYDDPALRAPGAGRSIKRAFADDGSLATVEYSDRPSPGVAEPPRLPVVENDAGVPATAEGDVAGAPPKHDAPAGAVALMSGGGSSDRRVVWFGLIGVAAAALVGAGAYRAREILGVRERW